MELDADIQELETLLKSATRNRVRKILEDELASCIARRDAQKAAAVARAASKAEFVGLKKYYWCDDGASVSVTLTELDGISSLSKDNISVSFTDRDAIVEIVDFNNRNYRFHLKDLAHDIDSSKSSHIVRKKSIRLNLSKVNGSTVWASLQDTSGASARKPSPKIDPNEDPSAGIMKMMKQMYEEGDDDMKRTISKAWQESRDKTLKDGGL